MIPLARLKSTVQRAFQKIARMKDLREVEVFASSSDHLLCRLNYTSQIPCHGVEEPKSSEAFGVGVRAVFSRLDGPRIGFGSEARDLSPAGVQRALEKARWNAVQDDEFVSLPKPEPSSARRPPPSARSSDRAIMELTDDALVEVGWRVVRQALRTFESSSRLSHAASKDMLPSLGLIVGGDVGVVRQRMAIASTHQPTVQMDETTFLTSSVTAMVESAGAKGTGYEVASRLSTFTGEAGCEAARHAIAAIGGQRVRSGTYTVILGPQPVSDLMSNLILPSLSADAFYGTRSTFQGEWRRAVAAPTLTLYDRGGGAGVVGSRRITCEGLPTGRTTLIHKGILEGLLSDYYVTQRLLRDPYARDKLGVNPREHPEIIAPRNGFRTASHGGRQFDVAPSIAATNVFIEGDEPYSLEGLLRTVRDGLYIGRIWYTYPVNGLRAGDFTCTVVGDSYLIRDGRLAEPLQGNTVRMTGNIRSLLRNIAGMTTESRPIVGWGSDEIIHAPHMAVRDVRLSEIAQFMQTGIQ